MAATSVAPEPMSMPGMLLLEELELPELPDEALVAFLSAAAQPATSAAAASTAPPRLMARSGDVELFIGNLRVVRSQDFSPPSRQRVQRAAPRIQSTRAARAAGPCWDRWRRRRRSRRSPPRAPSRPAPGRSLRSGPRVDSD